MFLEPPTNVKVALLGTTDVVIIWYPPQNQNITSDVIVNDTAGQIPESDSDEPVNGTVFSVTAPATDTNGTVVYAAPNGTVGESEDSNTTLMQIPTGTPVQVPESINNTQSARLVRPPCDKIEHYLVIYQEKNQSG